MTKLYAVHPDDWCQYGNDIINHIARLKIVRDIWYKHEDYDVCIPIQKEWRTGKIRTDLGCTIMLPVDLQFFYFEISVAKNALIVADKLEHFIEGRCQEILELIDWIRYWANKGSYFVLIV
jgi:hypothetical protein